MKGKETENPGLPEAATGSDVSSSHFSGRDYLLFELQGAHYGIATDAVLEILQLPELTRVDEAPAYVAGVLNYRTKVLPVIDLNVFFGHGDHRYQLTDCVIVLEHGEAELGIIVDRAFDVQKISMAEIEAVPEYGEADGAHHFVACMAKVGEEIFMLLDEELLTHHYRDIEGHLKNSLGKPGKTVRKKPSKKKGVSAAEQALVFCPEASEEERLIFHQRAGNLLHFDADVDTSDLLPLAVVDLGGEYYGVKLEYVREFYNCGKLTPVPCTPEHIIGNINVRGDILTLVDLRKALGMPVPALAPGAKAIIVNVDDIVAGVPVEAVRDIVYFSSLGIKPVPAAVQTGEDNEYLEGVVSYQDRVLSILNLPKIFNEGGLLVDEVV